MAIREDYVDISKKAPTEREVERTHVMYALREAATKREVVLKNIEGVLREITNEEETALTNVVETFKKTLTAEEAALTNVVEAFQKTLTEREVSLTNLVDSLRKADSEKMVEQVFEKAGIGSLDERITMLKEAQGGKKATHFYTPNFEDLTPEQQYTFELQVFLTGAWKNTQQYKDLMGY